MDSQAWYIVGGAILERLDRHGLHLRIHVLVAKHDPWRISLICGTWHSMPGVITTDVPSFLP